MKVWYELGIIGAGPAGYHAALQAAGCGLSVVVFEQNEPGGVCLFHGCIPTKSLVSTSKEYFRLLGNTVVKTKETMYDWEAARQKKERDIKKLASGLRMQLKQANIPIIKATGKIQSVDDAGVTVDAEGDIYRVKNLILATGSHNVIPSIEGIGGAFDSGLALDSTGILNTCVSIERLLVIGAGVAGLEIASIYANTGSKVIILECQDSFLPGLDDTVKAEYIRSLKNKGIIIKLGQQVNSVATLQTDSSSMDIVVRAVDRKSGIKEEYTANRILVATGRKGCTEHIGLENVPQIQVKNGFIETDDYHMTGCAHIYACGDVCGKEQLAYTAGLAGERIVRLLSHNFKDKDTNTKDCVPYVIFTNPEAAYIGMTEAACIEKGILYRTASCSMNYSSLFVVENERENGAFKIICDESLHILGCHIIGNSASDIIGTLQAYIAAGMTLLDIAELPVMHPSHLEIIKECIKQI